MAEFDDKLNSILSNPDAMAQIMQLAQSFSGEPSPPPPIQPPSPPPPTQNSVNPLSALGNLDPKLITRLRQRASIPCLLSEIRTQSSSPAFCP